MAYNVLVDLIPSLLFLLNAPTTTVTTGSQEIDSPTCQIGVAIGTTALLTIAIMAGLSGVIHIAVYRCIYKSKAKPLNSEPKDTTQSGDVVEIIKDIYEPV